MKWFRVRLRWQLMLSYLPVLLIPLLVTGIVTNSAAERGLTVLVTQEARRQADQWVGEFANYYRDNGSWTGVMTGLADLSRQPRPGKRLGPNPPPPNSPAALATQRAAGARNDDPNRPPQPEQILITDTNGVIVASDESNVIGQMLTAEALANGAPIRVNGKVIGTLVIGAALGILDTQQRQLLDTVGMALWVSGALSLLFALAVGLLLSRQITAPIKHLMRGVTGLTSGDAIVPLPVHYQNEFGDLTRAFNQMVDETTRQQRLRQQMVADIAHDLRTPLSVMALEVEGIRAGLQTPAEASDSLQEEIEWLQRLVEDLHMLSLMDAGQLDLRCEPTDPGNFLRNVFTNWQGMAAKENRPFALELAPALPYLSIDPHRIRQVLGNLLNNAFQHTPSSAPVTLSARQSEQSLVIEVSDRGQGIAPDDLPHIFDRFYRADRSRKRSMARGGSGLGLGIAKQLIALHGGELRVTSTIGKGTTFAIQLPIATPGLIL